MNAMRTNIVNRALRYVGISERPPGSNHQPFGVKFGFDGVAWCQEFDWIVRHECGQTDTHKTASTMEQVAYARKMGWWHNGLAGIQPADPLYLHWSNSSRPANQPDHVEISVAILHDGVTTVGGNVSNMVHKQNRRANILGYIRYPQLADKAKPVVAPKPLPPVVALRYREFLSNVELHVGPDLKSASITGDHSVPKGAKLIYVGTDRKTGKFGLFQYKRQLGWCELKATKSVA